MRTQSPQSAKLHQVNMHLDNDAAVVFKHHLVHDGRPLTVRSGANQITWGYSLLTAVFPTYGGEVQQILGARIEELTINGQTRDNHQLEQIYDFFKAYMAVASGFGADSKSLKRSEEPIVFTYPTRKWSFSIQVTDLSGFKIGTGLVATPWQIKAIIVPSEDADGPHLLAKITMDKMTSVLIPSKGIPVGIGYRTENSYSDPTFGGIGDTLDEMGRNAGDQFQKMLGQFSLGDFSSFIFQAGAPTAFDSLNQEAKDAYIKIFGSNTLVTTLTGPGGSETAGASGSTSGGGSKGTCSIFTDNMNTFANRLAELSGFDVGFIMTWMIRENPKGDKVEAGKTRHKPDGDHNWLNVGQNDGGETGDGASSHFPSAQVGAEYTWDWIKGVTPGGGARDSITAMVKALPGKSVNDCLVFLSKTGWATADDYLTVLQSTWNTSIKPNLTYAGGTSGTTFKDDGTNIGKVYAKCQQIDSKKLPYGHAGHGGPIASAESSTELDCSSSTSLALNAGGFVDSIHVSGDFLSWGEAGEGKQMTVWVNPGTGDQGHVMIQWHGKPFKRFDTSPWSDTHGRGPRLRDTERGYDGMVARRVPGDS